MKNVIVTRGTGFVGAAMMISTKMEVEPEGRE
jgi:hypothetical protein